jgi:hypothetical protein
VTFPYYNILYLDHLLQVRPISFFFISLF